MQGYKIKERNWKTKYCEIDIVAETKNTRYFIEVKFRTSSLFGDSIGALTPKKLKQMRFAAELYSARYPTTLNECLAAVIINPTGSITLIQIE